MKYLLPLMLSAPLFLAACDQADTPRADMSEGTNPLAGASLAADGSVDSCGANRYADLVGQTNPSISVPEGTTYRAYGPGDPVTRDFRLDRINFEYDRGGKLLRVSCG